MHRSGTGRLHRRIVGHVAALAAVLSGVATITAAAPAAAAEQPPAITPIVPGRLLDTRPGEATVDGTSAGAGKLGAGQVVELPVAGRHGIPADAAAVMLNVTAVTPDAAGYLTVWPCGQSRPLTSSVNYVAGQVVPNAVLSKVGAGGRVCIMTLASAHVLADVTGYVPAGGAMSTLVPGRLLDTRAGGSTVDGQFSGVGRVAAGGVLELAVRGRHGVPGDASAVMLNVTAVAPDAAGYLTVFPCGATRPRASSVNYVAQQVVPNAVLAQIGTGGKVCIFSLAATDVVADVTGFVPAGGGVATVVPGRLLDTRPGESTVDNQAAGQGLVPAGGVVELQVAGRHGVPGDASAVMLNVTAVTPDAAGYLTVWPCGAPRPRTSSVNYRAGQVVPNAVLSQVGTGGKVCIFTLARGHVLADITAYVPAAPGGNPGPGPGPGPGEPTGDTGATFLTPDFDKHSVTIGPDGTAHLVYVDAFGERAWYASCAANCATDDGWTSTMLFTIDTNTTTEAGTGGIGVDATGRVHALFDGWADPGGPGFFLRYVTCAANCHNAANWSITTLATGETGAGMTSADAEHVLAVAPNGTVSFVSASLNEFVEWEALYWQCASACAAPGNWTATGVFLGYPLMAERDANGTLHALFHTNLFSTDELRYARCASNCSNPGSWDIADGAFPFYAGPAMTITESGRVFVGYLQGLLGQQNDRRYVVYTCTGVSCGDLTNWTVAPLGENWEGTDGADLASAGEEVVLITTSGEELRMRTCSAPCTSPAAFGAHVVVDHNEVIGARVNPVLHSETDLCDSADPNWWGQSPMMAMTSTRALVAHRPYGTYVCYPDNVIYDLASIGRVLADF